VARLNALPYTTLCIDCQRKLETNPDWLSRRNAGDWEKVFDVERPIEDQREVKLSDLVEDFSK
jgi:DnaK suppressor protein